MYLLKTLLEWPDKSQTHFLDITFSDIKTGTLNRYNYFLKSLLVLERTNNRYKQGGSLNVSKIHKTVGKRNCFFLIHFHWIENITSFNNSMFLIDSNNLCCCDFQTDRPLGALIFWCFWTHLTPVSSLIFNCDEIYWMAESCIRL